jgi:hypothetical protein
MEIFLLHSKRRVGNLLLINIYKTQNPYNYLQSIFKQRVFTTANKMPS